MLEWRLGTPRGWAHEQACLWRCRWSHCTPWSWPVVAGGWPVLVRAVTLLVAVPTDLVDTPLFWREIPPTWWSWPALVVSAPLAALVAATYVNRGGRTGRTAGGSAGGVLTFFAVGCPVCNKLALVLWAPPAR